MEKEVLKEEFQKNWRVFLAENDLTLTEIAKHFGDSQQGLGRKINQCTIKYLYLSEILDRYGYKVEFKKK